MLIPPKYFHFGKKKNTIDSIVKLALYPCLNSHELALHYKDGSQQFCFNVYCVISKRNEITSKEVKMDDFQKSYTWKY